MTQAFNLAQFANYLNTSGQVSADGIQAGAIPTSIPTGTVMIFGQTAAPTGFTKLTNFDNYALRVVSGTASTGGSVAFTTAFSASLSAGATTLSTAQIPSHTHSYSAPSASGSACASPGSGASFGFIVGGGAATTGAQGGGGSHTHTIPSLAVQYVDVIRATKD